MGILSPGCSIVEFGAQEVNGDPEAIRCAVLDIAKHLGKKVEVAPLRAPVDMSAMYRLLGFEHKAIDVNYLHGSDFFDLNTERVPESDRGRYDWVNNEGTTEHVINQMNALCAAHDYCKSGGHMTHSVPVIGWVDHGLMNATPKFWALLAGANDYKMVSARFVVDPIAHKLPEWYSRWESPADFTYRDVWLHLIFQKTKDRPFVIPVDHLEFDKDGTVALRLKENAAREQQRQSGSTGCADGGRAAGRLQGFVRRLFCR
jgi:hypothetical protein